jgi:hypothetical protein
MQRFLKITSVILLLMTSSLIKAQDNTDGENTQPERPLKHWKVGMYIGSYFSNKYTASAYDGYGYDINGKRNAAFEDSYMYEKIINEYGGVFPGTTDQIAVALGVNHTDWFFTKDDMPVNMHYTPAFILGIEGRYSVDKKNAIELNLNFAKLSISGNFTISTLPPAGSTQINKSIQTFGIKGGEQRLMMQVGYCHLFGDNENFNFLLEGGLNITYAKFAKDEILINSLKIDLTGFYDYQGVQSNYTRKPQGWGLGAYAGAGINISTSDTYTVQLVYNPSYEGIKIVENSKLKWQHAIALRAYLNF